MKTFVWFLGIFLVVGVTTAALAGCDLLGKENPYNYDDLSGKIVYSAQPAENAPNQIFMIDKNGAQQLTFADKPHHIAKAPT